jgi:U3 small nucleolar RNA-associated protein 14
MAKNTGSRPGTFRKTQSHGKGNQNTLKSKANAASGYARRQSVKDKKQSQNVGDLYEYEQDSAPRRSKVRLELDRDEEQEFGGLDEMDEAQRDNLRARLIGENDDDEKVASDDDEEIDSDAAFEESDEERYAEFFPGKVSFILRLL